MTCTSARRLIRRIVTGQASPEERTQLATHLGECAACTARWQQWPALLTRLEQAAPPAVTTDRDLVGVALAAATASAPRTHASGFRTFRLAAAVSLVLLLSVGGLTVWHRSGRGRDTPERLLSAVEAAMVLRPMHQVRTIYGAGGGVVERFEQWQTADGEGYYQESDFQGTPNVSRAKEPTYSSGWIHPGQRVSWTYSPTERTYRLGWQDSSVSQNLPPGLFSTASPEDIVRWWRRMSGRLTVTERTATLAGKQVRVIRAVGTLPSSNEDLHLPPMTIDSYLSPDGSLLRQTTVISGPDGTFTIDTYPIEYNTIPPASLVEPRLPAGAKVMFEQHQVAPVWETMPESEKRQVTATVEGLAEAWRKGDFAGFSRYFDFAAGLQYGVKGRWTADELRNLWRGMVEQQRARWREDKLVLDYVVGTSQPPGMALDFWSIYTRQGSDKTYHVYRDKPSTEPGLLVLAREQVTDQQGKTRELRTRLFVKKLGGQYKVVLWRPPFA